MIGLSESSLFNTGTHHALFKVIKFYLLESFQPVSDFTNYEYTKITRHLSVLRIMLRIMDFFNSYSFKDRNLQVMDINQTLKKNNNRFHFSENKFRLQVVHLKLFSN